MRDDFSKQTVMDVARAVGYRCSNPECNQPTVGANAAQDGIVTIGVAAHICAASSGGPRYNAAQSREARRSKDNGIWLCQNCGRLVDADAQKFSVEVLTGWRRVAQERAFRELVAPETPALRVEAVRVGTIIAADNANTADPNFDRLFEKVHVAATGSSLRGPRNRRSRRSRTGGASASRGYLVAVKNCLPAVISVGSWAVMGSPWLMATARSRVICGAFLDETARFVSIVRM